MNYSSLIKGLICDIKKGIQYKFLGNFGILAGILALPYILATVAQICGLYVMLFFYNGITASIDYLESWLKGAKEGVHHATEAVLYFVCMPMIFSMRVFISFFAVIFYFNWFTTMCLAYLATLGGIKWQPFIASATFEDIDWEVTTNATVAKGVTIAYYCLNAFSFLLILVGLLAEPVISVAGLVFLLLGAAIYPITTIVVYRKKVAEPAEAPVEEPVEA